MPYAFTEQGVAMLSAVIPSKTAINEQYPPLEIRQFNISHDRFLIIDETDLYHFGASLKDLVKKWFAFSKMEMGASGDAEKTESQAATRLIASLPVP